MEVGHRNGWFVYHAIEGLAVTKRTRRGIEAFSMSFLDVISCGFGAIILLLIITLALEPRAVHQIKVDLSDKISLIKESREKLIREGRKLNRELAEKKKKLQEIQERFTDLNERWAVAEGRSAEKRS